MRLYIVALSYQQQILYQRTNELSSSPEVGVQTADSPRGAGEEVPPDLGGKHGKGHTSSLIRMPFHNGECSTV